MIVLSKGHFGLECLEVGERQLALLSPDGDIGVSALELLLVLLHQLTHFCLGTLQPLLGTHILLLRNLQLV